LTANIGNGSPSRQRRLSCASQSQQIASVARVTGTPIFAWPRHSIPTPLFLARSTTIRLALEPTSGKANTGKPVVSRANRLALDDAADAAPKKPPAGAGRKSSPSRRRRLLFPRHGEF